mmetsp:Transcript_11894/g.25121  ORF Transcript_11894/g.25121 Transcript_11894/m.25121 type:complete len:101 (+) Transcript_11894:390-692(+)
MITTVITAVNTTVMIGIATIATIAGTQMTPMPIHIHIHIRIHIHIAIAIAVVGCDTENSTERLLMKLESRRCGGDADNGGFSLVGQVDFEGTHCYLISSP